ncbi:MAG: sulfatase-like hydrolase/transferase [Candidatus Eremiobacteraeota bacterium]|nr:sulfatase-like hydrolase/transferase [Candidatus Eremiobacteraeota bacterium]
MAKDIQREVLPIPDKAYAGFVAYDAKDPDSKFPPIEPLRPPGAAPNVLIVLIDDAGYGASSAFGGPCASPTAERLAKNGLQYTRFHTTALCSPSRAALLAGRNHHTVGMGGITEIATSAPGYNSMRPNTMAPLPEILRLNGYSTAQFGKCHEVPVWEASPVGPFDRWPTGSGFEYFYGFVAGETNQWYPAIHEGTKHVEPPKTPEEGYHFMEDMTDRAIAWVRQQRLLAGDKPFFMYFAPGATHAPHHVPKEWADKYKGKFDQGWDKLREETFARQKKLGVIPPNCDLTVRPKEIPAWDSQTPEFKRVLAREMEVYAGFFEYADHHIGRLLDALKEVEALDNTLIFYIIGDNGASAEGTPRGTFNEVLSFNGMNALETDQFLLDRIDKLGGPESYNHYAVAWAHAMDTPYQWTKQVASHWGGTRNGMIVHWPKGIKARGDVRNQFHHVIDVAPTVLECAQLPEPVMVNGVGQVPMQGVSMAYSFEDSKAPERRETQYFEMFGNRGIYHKGWTAVTRHRTPWLMTEDAPPFNDDIWELYDTTKDWSQAHDLSKQMPDKLHELQRLWLIEATRNGVLPLDDRTAERFNSDLAGRPVLISGNSQVLAGGMGGLNENGIVNVKNKSHSVTAELIVPDDRPANGVILSQGGIGGGWMLYVKNGKLTYLYNLCGLRDFVVASGEALTPGKHQVRMEFAYDGGGLAKGGTATLFIDGKQAGSGRIEQTVPMVFSADETTDVGVKFGSPMTSDVPTGEKSAFNGTVIAAVIELKGESTDHLLSKEEVLNMIVARQ